MATNSYRTFSYPCYFRDGGCSVVPESQPDVVDAEIEAVVDGEEEDGVLTRLHTEQDGAGGVREFVAVFIHCYNPIADGRE